MRIVARRPAILLVLLPALAILAGLPWAGAAPARPGARPGPAAPAPVMPTTAPAKKSLPIQWSNNFAVSALQSAKTDKMILLYFSGSDWDEWGQKLEKEVLNTELFRDWVAKHVIPVNVDFPKEKKVTGSLKGQNDALKVRFAISKVPTFLFIDPSGEVLARVGYDTARLRDHEAKEQPKEWIDFCQSVVDTRPPKENLIVQKSLKEAVTQARKHAMPILILGTQNPTERILLEKQTLIANQQFVRFINRNLLFVDANWPAEYDKSPDAEYFRQFATQWKFGPSALQLVLWDPGGLGRLKMQITSISAQQVGPLIKRIDAELPSVDYTGGWIEDYKLARTIAARRKKDLFVAFVSMNGSEWSQKMFTEVFDTPEFKAYAKENLVLLKIDYPKGVEGGPKDPTKSFGSLTERATAPREATTQRVAPTTQKSVQEVKEEMVTGKDGSQPFALQEQNRMLADMYAIRGYPAVIILNDLGQKIGDAKYMKGGQATFIAEMDKLRKKDRDRRFLISEQEAAK